MSKGIRMTEETITEICEDTECFKTPSLNHQLLLHRRGFRKIENLDAFINVKTLFLEGNSISKIENLHPLEHLRALYLQGNCIGRELKLENLAQVSLLRVLNLESNGIKTLEGFPRMGSLETLILRNNEIECIIPILRSMRLITIDLSCNRISDAAVLDHLGQLEDLKVLYMKSNPIIETMSFYRKRALVKVPHLTFLDDRPIFPNEKRLSEAWVRGGRGEEESERELIRNEHEQGSGRTRHYTIDEDERFSSDDSEEKIVDGVQQYTIAGELQEEEKTDVNEENVSPVEATDEKIEKNPPVEVKLQAEKGEVLDKTIPESNNVSVTVKKTGTTGLDVKEGQWNVTFDQLLTMNAAAYQYDFAQVSDHMRMIAVSDSFAPEFYSKEECENRWKTLDNLMRNETWVITDAAEACTEELLIAEANKQQE